VSSIVRSTLDIEDTLTRNEPLHQATDKTSGMYDLLLQNQRFDVALNNLSQGVCFFDGSRRLVLANRRYAEIYGLSPECIRPGTTLDEIVERRFAVNAFPNMTPEEYLDWRGSIATFSEPSDTIVELKNGRIISIHHRPMPDRGWVSTHEDITERSRIQEQMAHMARHDPLTGNCSPTPSRS
jgi:PAS domain-containing protein